MRYVCIHGHYYQPPRHDPATGVVPVEPSAAPYDNWNARITDECYRTNAAAPILDPSTDEVAEVWNNYAWTSFNFGPTLLAWLEVEAPDAYVAIIDADRESLARWGHGNAIAQGMHHAILPLCSPRDRATEVRWGIDDFVHRFERPPEGMWLPETAVDTPTLETLAEHGIAYTLLAPRQCRAVRAPGQTWRDTSGEQVDPRRPYRVNLPSGRSISVFFYDGHIAQGVAFGGLLNDGTRFANALIEAHDGPWPESRLVHVATDGESYGHHHRFGDMALAFALRTLHERPDIRLTNYAAYLAENPPTWEAQILEPSSWSCAHGVGRWRADCGCAVAPGAPGAQAWRSPLRDALDWLRDEVHGWFGGFGRLLVDDPWALRDEYHSARLAGPKVVHALLERHARPRIGRPLEPDERIALCEALDLERIALTMFTSCGWFFDHPSDIGTQNDLRAAAEVVRRLDTLARIDLGPELERRLSGVAGAGPLVQG